MINVASELEGEILRTVAFRFKGIHECDAIAAMPINFNCTKEMLNFMDASLGINAFDLFGIPAFSKRLARESHTVLSAMRLASEKHQIKNIVLFQTVDFHNKNQPSRFNNKEEEDLFHKTGLIEARRLIIKYYPDIKVHPIYVRLVNNDTEIEMAEVLPDMRERVRLVAKYRFQGIHECDTAVLMCMDFRFRRESRDCVRFSLDTDAFGLIGLPGASKRFLEDSESAWKAIKLACNNHGCKKIILFHHADCGAYGGLARFNGDVVAEELMHRKELRRLKKLIYNKYPEVEVVMVYARLIEDQEKIQFVAFD